MKDRGDRNEKFKARN